MLALSFFAAIFSSLLWLIYSLAYISDNTVGIKFSALGIVDISVYVALVALPILIVWVIFGYVIQYMNFRSIDRNLYILFRQMKKNQDYTDLIARIMLESEQQIKDGFILNRIDILISDMNELIAEIISRAALASKEQIESLWSKVRNGGKWALGKVIIEINQNQPNFQMRLYDKAQNDVVLAGTILEFCARYQNVLSLLNKHDNERVFLNVIETGVFGKVFTILAPLSDEIRKYRGAAFNKADVDSDFEKHVQARAPQAPVTAKSSLGQPNLEKKTTSLLSGLSNKIGSFIKKEKAPETENRELNSRDPFSMALERSFGQTDEEEEVAPLPDRKETPIVELSDEDEQNAAPEIILSTQEENVNQQEIILNRPEEKVAPSFAESVENTLDIKPEPISVPITNTQKTLNNLRKEWADMRKSSLDNAEEKPEENSVQPQNDSREEVLSYPFGGWTDESNYHK